MARRKRYFWHVPIWLDPGATWDLTDGVGNVAGDIVVELVGTNAPAAASVPVDDNFVVERIVGQYVIFWAEVANPSNRLLAHRIYPADSDQTSVAVRNLFDADDADSDFLWHKVEPAYVLQNGILSGTWASQNFAGGGTVQCGAPWQGRLGHVDVRVGRRINEGQSLVWHTEISSSGGGTPADGEYKLQAWLRVLCREA